MKRTKQTAIKTPDAILTADWHLRENTPTCRTDDFQTAQWNKVSQITGLSEKYSCPVVHAGDLFDHWKPSPWLLSKAMIHLPKAFYTIYGNHDLPQHNLDLEEKTGIWTLHSANRLKLLPGTHWEGNPELDHFPSIKIKDRNVLVYHTMTWKTKSPFPGCTSPRAGGLLRKYPEYDLILTGHNHQSFTETYKEKLLVNPGSITRQTSDQVNFSPKVWLYYADTNTVEPFTLQFNTDVITRAHIEEKEARDGRLSAFIESLQGEFQLTLNFRNNIEQFLQTNKVRKSVKEIIYKAIEI